MAKIDWDTVSSFIEGVGATDKTITFPKVQESVKLTNKGNVNIIYTIGTKTGTLSPSDNVEVKENLSSITVRASSGTSEVYVRASEAGTEKEEVPTDVVSLLAQKSTLNNDRVQVYNAKADTDNPLEVYNFAGQGTGSDQSGVSVHNYTDSQAVNIDNVGTGAVLVLGNSQNPTHRPDKPADFVGNGHVIRYRRYSNTVANYENIFYFDEFGNYTKTSAKPDGTGTLKLITNRATESGFAMDFQVTNRHDYPFLFSNGGKRMMYLRESGASPKLSISSDTPMTGGMEIMPTKGDLFLRAFEGKVKAYAGGYFDVQVARTCTTATRPTDYTVGASIFDTDLGKPIWLKTAPSTWVDATGTTV